MQYCAFSDRHKFDAGYNTSVQDFFICCCSPRHINQEHKKDVPGYRDMCYLAVCGIGHTPHCGYYRERSCVLIGAWLPGDWVI